MKRKGDPIRRFVSVGISTLMLTLSVAVPLMERAELLHEPVVESEHNPATCPPAHDHTVCTQVSANLAIASEGQERALPRGTVRLAIPTDVTTADPSAFTEGNPSRAPPLA